MDAPRILAFAGSVRRESFNGGGLRGLRHVREVLTTLGCIVLPEQYCLSGADLVIDEQGAIKDEKVRKGAGAIGARLATTLKTWSH